MEIKGIVNISTEHIHPHPDNPRKDLGDLTELAESIKKNGIMQNLTVIPMEGQPGEYITIIGHRRCGAYRLAEIKELPCRIVEGMTKKEQMSTMLEENMQRNDLTIYEQAQGFQMMLDLGETEETIAEKTGFSKTTIKHRLNIAKLNQDELKKKEQDDNFQLTLKDLYELEKVKDLETRNKILKEARGSRDIASRAQSAVSEAKRKENEKAIIALLKKAEVEKAPNGTDLYSRKWKIIKEYELDKEVPKQLRLPKENEKMYWVVSWRTIRVIIKTPKEKKILSKWELEQKERDKAKRQIKAVLKESSARRKEFVRNIISGKIKPVKDEQKIKDLIWIAMVELSTGIYESTLRRFFLDKDEYKCTDEQKQEANKQVKSLSVLHQMMIILHVSMEGSNETFDYNVKFNPKKGSALQKGYNALEPYGWFFDTEDEKKVLDGTHESYVNEE